MKHPVHKTHPNSDFPDGLHGQGDEAGDGVCHGQVEHQEVNICSAPENKVRCQK